MPKRLSDRQRECITLFARGMMAKEIGRHLGIQTKTVQDHIAEAYERLGVNTRWAAAQALGIEPGQDRTPIPSLGSDALSEPVGGASQVPETGTGTRTLYDLYVGLGKWRAPPRGAVGRILRILLFAFLIAVLFGSIIAVGSLVFRTVDVLHDVTRS
ncbi:helix-turn-helix transcriptional regulator [Brevundimonas sp.]|jgi:DNA-binding CsgD family transcriptional regulator|uniref:helix-turn-helix domain-containing protein n=1 Tax=Brevundimonas sp. TaxID=1871086 RepID=UPI002E135422|nr:helix-turn-helix transcriptional regulator [Brevundimonas sp.]